MKARRQAPPKPPVCFACLYQLLGQGSKPSSDSKVSCLTAGAATLSEVEPLESVAEECWDRVLMSLKSKAEVELCLAMLGPDTESCLCQAITDSSFNSSRCFTFLFSMNPYDSSPTLGPKGQLKETHITSGRGHRPADTPADFCHLSCCPTLLRHTLPADGSQSPPRPSSIHLF